MRDLKTLPRKQVPDKVTEIWNEYLADDASCPINVDSRSYEVTKRNLEQPDQWCYDVAAVCNDLFIFFFLRLKRGLYIYL